MLRAIHLKQFGLFSGKTFVVDPVTVFCGANQSGKSTIFDAIRIHTFHPERRSQANRALYERYGDETEVVLDWKSEPPEMSDEAYTQLFAVAAGNLELVWGGDWLGTVRRALFAGGVDPQAVQEALAREASDNRTYAHMRNQSRLERERVAAEQRLTEKSGQRAQILAGLEAQATRRAELQGLDARLGLLKGQEVELAEEAAWQGRIAERAGLSVRIATLDELRELERRLAAQPLFAQDHGTELDGLETAQREQSTAHTRAEAAQGAEQARLSELRVRTEQARQDFDARRTWRAGAATLQTEISLYRAGQTSRHLLQGTAAVLLCALGAAGFAAADSGGWGWAALAVGLLAGAATAVAPRLLEERWWLRKLKTQWRAVVGGEPGGRAGQAAEAGSLLEMNAALAQVEVELEQLEEDAESLARQVRGAETRQQEASAETERQQAALRGAAAAINDWLARHGVVDRNDYQQRLAGHQRLAERLAEQQQQLEAWLGETGQPDAYALRAELERRLAPLADVPTLGLGEAERGALIHKLEETRADLQRTQQQRHELDRLLHGDAERLAGKLGALPEEIAQHNDDLRRINAELGEIKLNREAAQLALELFQAAEGDERRVIAELGAEVAKGFAAMAGLEEARAGAESLAQGGTETPEHHNSVALAGLRGEDLRAVDAGGQFRQVSHLSSGAQHLLYLALRLEMGRAERQGRFALLCLDEPFAFLDPKRQMQTLLYLHRFLEITHWQLLLFTNEPDQAKRVQAVFPDARLHVLG